MARLRYPRMTNETNEKAAARRQLRGAGLMQSHTPPASQPFNLPPDAIGVSSVDEILERARAMRRVYEGTADETTLKRARGEFWDHPIWGRLFIGPMAAIGYAEIERAVGIRAKEIADLVYLQRGILAPQFEAAQVKELYEAGDGPATQELIAAIKRWNPTFEEKTSWVEACVGSDRLLLMFLTCAINCNLWPELTLLLEEEAEGALSEENRARRLMFQSLLRYLPYYGVVMDIQRLSDELNIPITMAGARAALEAQEKLTEAEIKNDILPTPEIPPI